MLNSIGKILKWCCELGEIDDSDDEDEDEDGTF